MSNREQFLAIVLIGLILLGVGGVGGYMLVYKPIQQKHALADQLEGDILKLDAEAARMRRDLPRLAQTKRRSLPPDENLAHFEYAVMMDRILRQANVPPGFSVTPVISKSSADVRSIPQLAGKKPAYTKVVTAVEFRRADMWNVVDFLKAYYKLDVLHQITHFSIERDEDPGSGAARNQTSDNRKDLTVKLTSEAIILDGAEKRRTLLPVPEAFAAVGGIGGYGAILVSPEIGRGITPLQLAPVLSAANRDYSYIVLHDLFHGTLPKPPSLSFDRIANVTAEVGQEIPPVKLPLRGGVGLGSIGFTARTESDLFPVGSLKLDETTHSLTMVPKPDATGEATIMVEAKAGNEVARAEFKVSVNPPEETAPPKPDISGVIKLIIAGTRNDGTAFAVIRDNANRLIYEVEATRRRVKVAKFWYLRESKKQDRFYENPEELLISDDTSSTHRRFKVVLVDTDGLVLLDLGGDVAKPAAKVPGVKGPPRGPGGAKKAAEGPADPLAGIVGAPGAAVQPRQPSLFRWLPGKPLSALAPIPESEARKILDRAAVTGPVGPAAMIIEEANAGN